MDAVIGVMARRNVTFSSKTVHSMVGQKLKVYLIRGRKTHESGALCPPHNTVGQERQTHYRSEPLRHIDKVN